MPSRTSASGSDAPQDDVEMQDASAGEEEDDMYEDFSGQRIKTVSLSFFFFTSISLQSRWGNGDFE